MFWIHEDGVLDPGVRSFGARGMLFWIQGDGVLDPGGHYFGSQGDGFWDPRETVFWIT